MAACCSTVLFFSCQKDNPIGPESVLKPDYVLPQGNAPQAANDRIKQLFDTYGSYFLYNFTQKDFEWNTFAGTSNGAIDSAVFGDPQYAGDMLQFLDDVWLKFLSDDFKKDKGIPYRVFMTDTIRQRRSGSGWPPGREYLYKDFLVTGKSMSFTGMNGNLRTMTPAQKTARKNTIIGQVFKYYQDNGIIAFPASFYDLTDYVNMPTTPVTANLVAYRNRGFLPGSYFNGNPSEWMYGTYAWTTARATDASSYLLHVTSFTDAQMAPFLEYPLIKQKFDLLVAHFQNEYGIDVRAIANATY